MHKTRLVIGIPMDEKQLEGSPSYVIMGKYVKAVLEVVGAVPILLPPLAAQSPYQEWLSMIDGLVLSGSASDIHPKRYGDTIKNPKSFFDENRDETNFHLIHEAKNMGMPILGICRGFQEINVALGGTLHQSIHQTEKLMDHREIESDDPDISYGENHKITAVVGGVLNKITNKEEWQVNSLHDQGIDRLATPLQAEAYAEDGLVEAFSLKDKSSFILATQWHIEWKAHADPCSQKILKAFANACIEYSTKSNRRR